MADFGCKYKKKIFLLLREESLTFNALLKSLGRHFKPHFYLIKILMCDTAGRYIYYYVFLFAETFAKFLNFAFYFETCRRRKAIRTRASVR